jgi:uncharacterized protein (TIGR02996 family)
MHHTADEFLKAIEAEPGDRARRLVFADWLDEHSQPEHAELIRVEEEMRALPVFADRFWELKPRRNDLRAKAGAEWCAKMRYGTECEPVFRHGIPDGWRERWRLIREFTERWHRVPMGDVGGRQVEIAGAETRLGRTLPISVREWIAFMYDAHAGTLNYADCTTDLGPLPRQPALSLLSQWLGGQHWAIRNDELEQSDPLVRCYAWFFRTRDEMGYEEDAAADVLPVTEFGLRYAFGSLPSDTEGGAAILQSTDPFIGEVTENLPVSARCGSLDLYEADKLLIAIAPSLWPQKLRVEVKIGPPLTSETAPPFVRAFLERLPVIYEGDDALY